MRTGVGAATWRRPPRRRRRSPWGRRRARGLLSRVERGSVEGKGAGARRRGGSGAGGPSMCLWLGLDDKPS
jgi:hypothetical protein